MKQWLDDPLLRKLLRNAGVLFSGSVAASLLGLASLAITARALGVEQFGILVLITTYVLIVDRLINFQSWQALVKYGADALENKRQDDFRSLIKFGLLLDVSTAVLGAAVAASAAWLVGGWLGWKEEHALMAAVYSGTVVFNVSGTPIAILRLFDKFKKTAAQQVYASAFKLAGVSVALLVGAGIWGFLLVWALTDIMGKLLLLKYAHNELLSRNLSGFAASRAAKISKRFPGIWGFVWTTNLNSSIRMTSRELDVLIVAAILGPVAVGLYKVAKQFASVIQKSIDPLYKAIYPELAKLYSAGQVSKFVMLALRSSVLAGVVALAIWLLFALAADHIILLTVGEGFLEAKAVLLWYMFAAVIAAAAFSLQPAMLSMGRPHTTLWVHLASTVIYFSALFPMLHGFGLIGAGIAYVIYYGTWSLLMLSIEATILTRKRRVYVV